MNFTRLVEAYLNLQFFLSLKVIGSSVLLIHDSVRVGAWLIDFAKTVQSPVGHLSHRTPWRMGNHEDGYLTGLDNLIKVSPRVIIPGLSFTKKLSIVLNEPNCMNFFVYRSYQRSVKDLSARTHLNVKVTW